MENDFFEELRRARALVVSLSKEIDVKNERLFKLESKCDETSAGLSRIMDEKDKLHKSVISEMNQVQALKLQNVHLKHESEIQRKNLELRVKEVETQEAQNELEKKNLLAEKEMLKVQKPTWSDDSISCIRIDDLTKELADKVDELEYIENLNQTLILKEHIANNELQEARKKLISDLQQYVSGQTSIGIKRMGEIDIKPFRDVCSEKFSAGDCEMKSVELSSLWQEHISNPNWHPLKREQLNGKLQEIIDENDTKLKDLRKLWGEAVYKAVSDALLELNEYNSSGRYPVPELWNFNKGRKASLKEGVECLIQHLTSSKAQKRKR